MSDNEMKTDQPVQKNRKEESSPGLFCRKCGSFLGTEAKFCGTCGTPVDAASSGQTTGQELQQFTDSAKAVAKAGINSARKNVAKGLGAAGEKISFAAEKMNQNKQANCTSQEMDVGENSVHAEPVTHKKVKRRWKVFLGIVSVMVVIFVLMNLFGKDPVKDMKNVKFDQYGSQTFGEAVEASIPESSWNSVKINSKHYTVTVSGFCPDLSSNIQIEFDVNYSGDYVYAKSIGVTIDGEYYDDIFNTALVMGIIYN